MRRMAALKYQPKANAFAIPMRILLRGYRCRRGGLLRQLPEIFERCPRKMDASGRPSQSTSPGRRIAFVVGRSIAKPATACPPFDDDLTVGLEVRNWSRRAVVFRQRYAAATKNWSPAPSRSSASVVEK